MVKCNPRSSDGSFFPCFLCSFLPACRSICFSFFKLWFVICFSLFLSLDVCVCVCMHFSLLSLSHSLYFSVSVCLSLSIYIYIYLSLSLSQSLSPRTCSSLIHSCVQTKLYINSLSLSLPLSLSLSLSVWLSLSLSISLSLSQSLSLYLYFSVSVSVSLPLVPHTNIASTLRWIHEFCDALSLCTSSVASLEGKAGSSLLLPYGPDYRNLNFASKLLHGTTSNQELGYQFEVSGFLPSFWFPDNPYP